MSKVGHASTTPAPLIIPPLSTHQHTLILLHGRGSNATRFSAELLAAVLPDGSSFQHALPHTKFIFPTATKKRAACFGRSTINQWFDHWSPMAVDTCTKREDLMYAGLKETGVMIHELLEREVSGIGAENVALGGLSQGCAAALVAWLMWRGEKLGAFVGMCGWLPFATALGVLAGDEGIVDGEGGGDGNIVFRGREDGDEEVHDGDVVDRAHAWLRDELDLLDVSLSISMPAKYSPVSVHDTPMFLAHGLEDEKVPVALGRQMRDTLLSLGLGKVEWMEQEGLGHWYSPEILERMVQPLTRHMSSAGDGEDENRHGSSPAAHSAGQFKGENDAVR